MKDFITTQEAAEELGVSARRVLALILLGGCRLRRWEVGADASI
jgi:hypothetical protein